MWQQVHANSSEHNPHRDAILFLRVKVPVASGETTKLMSSFITMTSAQVATATYEMKRRTRQRGGLGHEWKLTLSAHAVRETYTLALAMLGGTYRRGGYQLHGARTIALQLVGLSASEPHTDVLYKSCPCLPVCLT